MTYVLTVLLALCATLAIARADEGGDRLRRKLELFHENPAAFLDAKPAKSDAHGRPIRRVESLFTREQVESGDFISRRDRYRADIVQRSRATDFSAGNVYSEVEPNDRVEDLVDNTDIVRKISEMDRRGLRTAAVAETPWSDTYWPVYQGGASARYADPEFPASRDWLENFKYVSGRPATAILSSGDTTAIDRLAPAEKYDALTANAGLGLAASGWSEGYHYYDLYKEVESWMGICHGWAAASFMLSRPQKSVLARTPKGTELTFYPSDLKALASLLWAKTHAATRLIGGRCAEKSPDRDENGRVRDRDCFDTNPGTWHMAVVNQIGISKRSFIIDATFDYEVWNQPVFSYSYKYFNPQTLEQAAKLKDAVVSKSDYQKDKFKKYRSREARYFVGIEMTLKYVVEVSPTHNTLDSPESDSIRSVSYLYDLELDAKGGIIGGEWYTNLHPDFLWTPAKNARALSVVDRKLGSAEEWHKGAPLPETWQKAAADAAEQGQPVARIVESLLERARD